MNWFKSSVLFILLSLITGGLVIGCGGPAAGEKTASAGDDIAWLHDVAAATKQSADSKEIIMVDVFTDWCTWCKKLDAEVFVDPKVVELSRKNVNLKVNAEDNGPGTALAQKFGVDGYPTILFLKAEGTELTEVDRIVGFLPAADFATEVERISTGGATFAGLRAAYDAGTMDIDQQYSLATKYMQRGQAAQAQEILLKIDPAALKDEESRKGLLLTLFNTEFQQQNFPAAEGYLKKFLDQYPTDENAARIRYYVLVTRGMQHDLAGAKTALADLKQKNPEATDLIKQAEAAISELEKQTK